MTAIDPYSFGALQKDHHERLVADLDGFAADAGILPHQICLPLPEVVTEAERAYLRNFRIHRDKGVSGMVLTGKNLHLIELRHIEQTRPATATASTDAGP